jgi:DJ-1 family protein
MDIRVLLPIAQGTEELEAITVIDLLRRAGISVIVSGDADIITCSRGVKIIPDTLLDSINELDEFDAVILPGGGLGTKNLMENSHLEKLLKCQKQKGKLIAAICAAPTILDAHHLINEDNAITSHPSVENILKNYNYREENVVIDGNFITSRGAGTAIDFALAIIERLVDSDTAERVAKEIVY